MTNILDSSSFLKKPSANMYHSIYQSEVIQCLLELEQRFGESRFSDKNRIALFDLDNTLIVGDIGDAVFAQLLVDGVPLPLTWKEYQILCKEDPVSAYVEVVRAMEGRKIEQIIQVSKRVLQSEDEFLVCENEAVRLPKPNLLMKEIVRLLREWHYSIFIVSASNDISAKIAGSVLFDIPINNIAGIKPMMHNHKLTCDVLEPIPVGIGKVSQYRLMSGDRMPLIVASDSELDLPLFHLCDPDGIAIVVGENMKLHERAKKELSLTTHLYQIPNEPALFFQQQHRVA
jgi:phosphoserine phosphatase